MTQDSSFDALMKQLQAGDQSAATEIVNRFAQRLIALASSRLSRQIKPKVDPADVVQSVFGSFFIRYKNDQFVLEDWDGMWGLLTILTIRKCCRQLERYGAKGRDVNREVPQPTASGESSSSTWQAFARDPTPSEAAILDEILERLMTTLDEREQSMLSMRLQGYKIPEISAQVGRTERTVRRVLDRVKKHLQRLQAEEEDV